MIIIVDNFLTKEECNSLIQMWLDNQHILSQWPEECKQTCSYHIKLIESHDRENYFYPLDCNPEAILQNTFYKDALLRMELESQKHFGNHVMMHWGELKRNDKGHYHKFHKDMARPDTILSSIVYLNDEFQGGHTIFEDGTSIAPVPGRMVIFDGMQYLHGASQNIGGFRYTIPIWYKSK